MRQSFRAACQMGLEDLFKGSAEILLREWQDSVEQGEGFQDLIDEMRRRIRHAEQVRSGAAKRERLLRRYVREAQSYRDGAFADWIAYIAEQRAPSAPSPASEPSAPELAAKSARKGNLPKRTPTQP